MRAGDTCGWHQDGVPVRFQGEAFRWRWFVTGCRACAKKWEGRKIPADVPMPSKLIEENNRNRPKVSWSQRHHSNAARLVTYSSSSTPRVA